MAWYEESRPRRIVKLASGLVNNKQSKRWFFEDPTGKWEKLVAHKLDMIPAAIEKHNLTLTDEQIDNDVANYIVYESLKISIANAKKAKT
jgi:hypothetical protein